MKCPRMIVKEASNMAMARMMLNVDNPAFILEGAGVDKGKWEQLLKSHPGYGRKNLYTGKKLNIFSRGKFVAKPRKIK